jgi:hypothetical protein
MLIVAYVARSAAKPESSDCAGDKARPENGYEEKRNDYYMKSLLNGCRFK